MKKANITTNRQEETKTAYMIVVANKFGVLYLNVFADYEEVMTKAKEELAKGRRVQVVEKEVPVTAAAK